MSTLPLARLLQLLDNFAQRVIVTHVPRANMGKLFGGEGPVSDVIDIVNVDLMKEAANQIRSLTTWKCPSDEMPQLYDYVPVSPPLLFVVHTTTRVDKSIPLLNMLDVPQYETRTDICLGYYCDDTKMFYESGTKNKYSIDSCLKWYMFPIPDRLTTR
jgi:hypothetical protein